MPCLLTHYEFFKQVENKPLEIGYLGTQGPDPFFFYGFNFWPTKRAKAIRKFGDKLHEIDPYITFKFLIDYINDSKSEEKPILQQYLKGMLAHYVLDRNAHPYVYYLSGFVTKKDKNTKKYFLNHAKVEASIDSLIMEHYKDTTKTYKALNHHNYTLKIVSKMLYHLAHDCFNDEFLTKKSYFHSVKTMRTVYRILYTKKGYKKKFFDKFFKNTPLSAMCEPLVDNIRLDYVNYGRKVWHDCVTGANPRSNTFYEVFEDAKKDYSKGLKIVQDIFDGHAKAEKLQAYTNNITHHGFEVGAIKQHFNSIFRNQVD